MLINKLGEFGLIERFRRAIRTDTSVAVPSGDDCAVLRFNRDSYQLFTCDMLVEGVDFTLRDKPELIGRKALAVCLSDIAACAGIPRYALVSLGIPPGFSVERIERIARGLFALAGKFKVNIVGGDISRARHLVIDVSVLGVVEKKNLCLRSGAKEGDIIFVTGSLGGSIRGKHLKFTPRLKEARALVKKVKVSSMIDISDGLTQDLGHILEQSKAGAVIYEDLIPLEPGARNLKEALFMGEDFELLFTLPPAEAKKILILKPRGFKPIGEITAAKQGLSLIDRRGRQRVIKPRGFRHF